jgi:hypothetical protein
MSCGGSSQRSWRSLMILLIVSCFLTGSFLYFVLPVFLHGPAGDLVCLSGVPV